MPVASGVLPHKRIFFTVRAVIDQVRTFHCVPIASEEEDGKKRMKKEEEGRRRKKEEEGRRKKEEEEGKGVTYIRQPGHGSFPPSHLGYYNGY